MHVHLISRTTPPTSASFTVTEGADIRGGLSRDEMLDQVAGLASLGRDFSVASFPGTEGVPGRLVIEMTPEEADILRRFLAQSHAPFKSKAINELRAKLINVLGVLELSPSAGVEE